MLPRKFGLWSRQVRTSAGLSNLVSSFDARLHRIVAAQHAGAALLAAHRQHHARAHPTLSPAEAERASSPGTTRITTTALRRAVEALRQGTAAAREAVALRLSRAAHGNSSRSRGTHWRDKREVGGTEHRGAPALHRRPHPANNPARIPCSKMSTCPFTSANTSACVASCRRPMMQASCGNCRVMKRGKH
jgi:hypothetical protein